LHKEGKDRNPSEKKKKKKTPTQHKREIQRGRYPLLEELKKTSREGKASQKVIIREPRKDCSVGWVKKNRVHGLSSSGELKRNPKSQMRDCLEWNSVSARD